MQSLGDYIRDKTYLTVASMFSISIAEAQDLVTISFNKRKTRFLATCWPNQYKIVYYTQWILANMDNLRVIDDIITHECAHLVTGPEHNKKFYRLCRQYGAMYENEYFDNVPYLIRLPEYITV
jgi:predicted metal-dependent hydrolase